MKRNIDNLVEVCTDISFFLKGLKSTEAWNIVSVLFTVTRPKGQSHILHDLSPRPPWPKVTLAFFFPQFGGEICVLSYEFDWSLTFSSSEFTTCNRLRAFFKEFPRISPKFLLLTTVDASNAYINSHRNIHTITRISITHKVTWKLLADSGLATTAIPKRNINVKFRIGLRSISTGSS